MGGVGFCRRILAGNGMWRKDNFFIFRVILRERRIAYPAFFGIGGGGCESCGEQYDVWGAGVYLFIFFDLYSESFFIIL